MKKLLSMILSITMLFAMSTAVFADGVDGPLQSAKIKVGTSADFKPFEFYDETGNLTGFDIDLMNYIGERIGFDIEYVTMSFDKLIPAVVNGEVDCAISGITATDERESVVDCTRPYLTANVTYEGEESVEEYGIVFQNGLADAMYKSSVLTDEEILYMEVDRAILNLKKDGTILKLIEKYELNSGINDDESYQTTYSSMVTIEDTQSDGRATPTIPSIPGSTSEEIAATLPAPSEWVAKDIDFAYAIRIMEGRDYNFKAPITREEFSELIYNLILAINQEISATHNNAITDTTNPKMLVLNGLGIINGKSETTLAPNDFLTREEAATIIVRMINKVVPMAATEMWFEYDDNDEISPWASDSIQTISNLGFMNGVGENRFAPKNTYTTEQAIATLVRVYRGAEAAGAINHNASIGMIGGSDGPTSIIVGDNANVIEQEDYENFYVEVTKNTKKVDDFYVEEAIKLITESGTLAGDKDFISLYTPNDDMANKILSLSTVDFSKPVDIFYFSADRGQIIANIQAMAEAEGITIQEMGDAWLEHFWKRLNFSTLASLINSSYGAENLAALTILTNSRGYVMPKDFKDDFALFVQYEGDYSAMVSFLEYGDGVISANMSFVKNGNQDNVFKRLYEITSALGEDSIKTAKVER